MQSRAHVSDLAKEARSEPAAEAAPRARQAGGHRPRRLTVLLWLLVSGCFLGALAAQVAAVPSLAQVSGARSTVEPLPAASPTAPHTLAGAVDNFPLVVTSFSGAASSRAGAEVAHANVMDGAAQLRAFDDVWVTLITPTPTTATSLGTFLISAPDLQDNPGAISQFSPWAAVFPSLFTRDADNAARLSNAAVALFMLAIAQDQGAPSTARLTTPEQLALDSEWLLLLTQRAFAASFATRPSFGHPAVIDLAWELSTELGPPLGTLAGTTASGDPVDILQSWLRRIPNDTDARYLLGHVLAEGRQASSDTSRPNPDTALQAALAALTPLASGTTTALADSAIGDAYFTAARHVPSIQPYHATSFVQSALHGYDQALQLNTDPSLYAARARALHHLGHDDDARVAASRAAELSDRSAEAEVLLSVIDESRGDFSDMRDEARAAARKAADGSALTLDAVRFLSLDIYPFAAGNGGYSSAPHVRDALQADSYRSLLPHVTVWSLVPPGLGGASAFVGIQVPQTRDPQFDRERDESLLPDQAGQLAMQASLVLADAAAADSDYSAWTAAMKDERLRGSTFSLYLKRIERLQLFDYAAHPPNQSARYAAFNTDARRDTILRRAKRFSDDANDWTAALSAITDSDQHATGTDDLAEAQYLGGHPDVARAMLIAARERQANSDVAAVFYLDLVAADLKLKMYGEASGVVDSAASSAKAAFPSDAIAEQRGEVEFVQGHTNAASSDFGTAVTDFHAEMKADSSVYDTSAADYLLEYSNLGTALLQSLQSAPDTAPDCTAHASTCTDAESAYRAALSVDPDNPGLLMNLGWTQRLLGHVDAERSSLEHAASVDPTLFPALNDLGIVYAQSGDADRAATLFEQAIAANPRYDLAIWNLGVLDMGNITSLPRAQALLARAAQLNPNLRGAGLDYRTDERIYTVAFVRGAAPPFTTAYSVGVVVLGSTGLVSLLLLVLGEFTKERGREFAVTRLEGVRGRWLRVWTKVPAFLRSSAGSLPATVIALLLGTIIVTVWANTTDRLSLAAIAVFAAVLGIVVHEAGHLAAARALKRGVAAATAPGGIAVALLMIPFRLIGGPYVGHRVVTEPGAAVGADEPTDEARGRNLVVYLAGPLANALVLAACAVVFLFQPVPALKVVLLVQLGIITFSLLPLKPMEGATLTEEHPWLVGIALFALVVVGVVFAQGVL